MIRLDPDRARRREQLLGALVVLVGVAVLVISIVALVAAVHGDGAGSSSGPQATLPAADATTSGDTPSGGTATGGAATPTAGVASTPATSTPPATPSADPTAAAGTQPLVVLNNTSTRGLAARAAETFENAGWTVDGTGNADVDSSSTCAYFDPDVAGAQAAATALQAQFPAVGRVAAKLDGLPDGPVVVVLDSDYTGS